MRASLCACLLLAAGLLPDAPLSAQPRIPIDLGPDAPSAASAPQQIDLTAPAPAPQPAEPAALKECADRREAGVVAGEIIVCRELGGDPAQFYSGSRAQWLRGYAERTQGSGTIPAPDVAGPGIFSGPATVSGLCFIPPCPKAAPLIIDVAAIPLPPPGSDAERVAQGLAPVEADDAPLDPAARRRIDAELGLPQAVKAEQQ